MPSSDIGEVRRVFAPSRANLIAGIILGVLAILAAIAMAIGLRQDFLAVTDDPLVVKREQNDLDPLRFAIGIAIAIGLTITGILVIRWSLSRFSFRIHVYDAGLEVRDANAGRFISWGEIDKVEEIREFGQPLTSRSRRRNPDHGNTVRDHVALGTMIKEATDPRGVPWDIREVVVD
jgi:hypothetical protein